MEYEMNQTPIERLRNKLTPFMVLVELLPEDEKTKFFKDDWYVKDDWSMHNNDRNKEAKEKNRLINEQIAICKKLSSEIKEHLNDCESYYSS